MLISVKEACVLQDNALDIRVSGQVEQLDQLIQDEGSGADFFSKKTHITNGMRTLITEGLARLAGQSSQAIFHLRQAMGGGKTHLLVGFGLLAKHPELRAAVCPEVPYGDRFGAAQVAAFYGRNSPDHFFWGEIALQLGKPELFGKFWKGGPRAPDEKDWLTLFDGGEPILILLDEMPPYFHVLGTQKVGNGTVADIATRAFANMLTAAGKKASVCIVVSDLAAVYESGSKLIQSALEDARNELGRQERSITPVDLTANEVYAILRKRLFKQLPDQDVIDAIADQFGRALEEATKAKVAARGAEAIADEIAQTYPFHPRLKNLVALFKENEQYKQTRGLMELVSRLLKSVWSRPGQDVFLIGPQHFDLSLSDVREKLTEISEMRDVIARDVWDSNSSSHIQVIDLQTGGDAASQVGALLLTASLSTAVNAVKGLTREEMVECLVTPLREASSFLAAFDAIEARAWYLHHTPEGRYYFDRQENLTKLLQNLAHDAPQPQIDDLIRNRLGSMYQPERKTVYSEVLPLPKLDEVVDKVRRGRVLLIVSPDSKLLTEDMQRFFSSLTQKNNVCILTGEKTELASLEHAARQLFAVQKADSRIPKTHVQREDLERKQEQYDQFFTTTILSLFDKVIFPVQRQSRLPELRDKPLDMTRDAKKPYKGEEQIEKTLSSPPQKLYLDIEANFDLLRERAETLLWPQNQDDARWSDMIDRAAEQAAMPWLPPNGIDALTKIACNRGLWEDLGNSYFTKKPKKKQTSAQVFPETEPDDQGRVRLRVNAQNGGPAPKLYYSENGPVTEQSPILTDTVYFTNALRVQFLVKDPSGQYETGAPFTWNNKLVIRNKLENVGDQRRLSLFVVPTGQLRYTLDGSEPREGTEYTGPFVIGNGEVTVRVFASADGLESKADFRFQATTKKGLIIDPVKPAAVTAAGVKKLDARTKVFSGLEQTRQASVEFENVTLAVGNGSQIAQVMLGDIKVKSDYIEALLEKLLEQFDAQAPVTLSFRKAYFKSGHDLKQFIDKVGIDFQQTEVLQ